MSKKVSYQPINFQKQVLDTSMQIPVLADFWASWCGPCKFLSPIVLRLAKEAKGKWKHVKINTEENQEIAADWGIKGVPNLKLFYKGKVIADLSGAMEEAEMRNWLDDKLPSEAKALAIEASQLIAKGNTKKGIELLEKAIELDGDLDEARLLLAKLVVWNNPTRIHTLVKDIIHLEEAEELILLSYFMKNKMAPLKASESKSIILEAKKMLLNKDIDQALKRLIAVLTLNDNGTREFAKRLIIAIFHALGESNALTKKYRRQVDLALY